MFVSDTDTLSPTLKICPVYAARASLPGRSRNASTALVPAWKR